MKNQPFPERGEGGSSSHSTHRAGWHSLQCRLAWLTHWHLGSYGILRWSPCARTVPCCSSGFSQGEQGWHLAPLTSQPRTQDRPLFSGMQGKNIPVGKAGVGRGGDQAVPHFPLLPCWFWSSEPGGGWPLEGGDHSAGHFSSEPIHKAQHGEKSVWPCHRSLEAPGKGPKPKARLSHPSMPALGPALLRVPGI